MNQKNAWGKYPEGEKRGQVFDFAEGYRSFLSACKTERECTEYFAARAEKAGFKNLEDIISKDKKIKPGDKLYRINRGKALALFVIGEKPIEDGLNILGAHIDSPRLDIKQNPLYEDSELVLLDTHYYGGIKKYQWVTLPMALHGVVIKKDGTAIKISIGEDEADPVFGVSDLLIHLAEEQMKKSGRTVVEGEALDVLAGSIPAPKGKKDKKDNKEAGRVKKNILKILKDKYDIEEEDFLSAEIEVVPAGPARDFGFDRSMIMGYGHDDRVCSYPSFEAILDAAPGERTQACLLVDKEEIGSVGATGMESRFFEDTVAELIYLSSEGSDVAVRRAMRNSFALSSDVSAAYDPTYSQVFDKKNVSRFGYGLVFNKYTGSRGKSSSNDASAEYMAKLRAIMEKEDISFHTAELGKVDAGGGGTIAYILGNYGMNVIDSGVGVLSMHAPWEIISKVDLYESYRGYKAFLENA